jgi:RNA polymerase sigma-70 factor, ECF subfamily
MGRWTVDVRKAFEETAYKYLKRLYRLAYARLGNVEDAEDVVQETYLKAFRHADNFREGSNVEPWLVTILLNTVRDHVRRLSRNPAPVALDGLEETDFLAEMADGKDTPEEEAEKNEVGVDLETALKETPEWMLTPFLLREFEDMSYKDIATTLNLPIGTVMSRLSRARSFLSKRLALSPVSEKYVSPAPGQQKREQQETVGEQGGAS